MVIVALLMSIATPIFLDQIRRTKRATAEGALLDLASRQQAHMVDRRQFAAGENAITDLAFNAPPEIAADFAFAVGEVDNAASPPTFVVSATPVSSLMTGDTTCGMSTSTPLTVDQANTKTPSACWKK